MPYYVYKREDGRKFEWWQKINDEPLTECPRTGIRCWRVPAPVSRPIFKGRGFYETDYKGK